MITFENAGVGGKEHSSLDVEQTTFTSSGGSGIRFTVIQNGCRQNVILNREQIQYLEDQLAVWLNHNPLSKPKQALWTGCSL